MNSRAGRLFLPALLALAVVVGVFWQYIPMVPSPPLIEQISQGGWRLECRDESLAEDELARLSGARAVRRLYAHDSGRWVLTAIDGSANRSSVHDPAYCFLGGGWKLVSTEPLLLENGEASLLTLQKGAESRQLAVWFDDGRKAFSSPLEYWLKTTLRRLTKGISGPEPLQMVLYADTSVSSPDWPGAAYGLVPQLMIRHPAGSMR
jgi:hypothetical protein